jgi:hypothetical protein
VFFLFFRRYFNSALNQIPDKFGFSEFSGFCFLQFQQASRRSLGSFCMLSLLRRLSSSPHLVARALSPQLTRPSVAAAVSVAATAFTAFRPSFLIRSFAQQPPTKTMSSAAGACVRCARARK